MLAIALCAAVLSGDPAEMLKQADAAFGAQKYAEALEQYRAAADQADGSPQLKVEALAQVARCYSIQGKLDEGRPWLEQAQKLAKSDEPLGWSRVLTVRGIFERESGDKKTAKKTFEELHGYCMERKLYARAIDAIHHIALVVPLEEQPAWALKGIAAAEKAKDERWLAVLWNNLGATYEDLRQYDRMLEAYIKAQGYHHKTGGPVQKLVADWAVAHGYRLVGKLDEARKRLEVTLPVAEQLVTVHGPRVAAYDVYRATTVSAPIARAIGRGGLRPHGLRPCGRRGARAPLNIYESWSPDTLKQIDEALAKLKGAE